jgi:hypothetical protein
MQGGAIVFVYPQYVFPLPTQLHTQECPICTVSYPSMNTASCCSARVCTECFVYHQTASDPPGKAQCPFCKYTPFAVRVSAGACSRAVLSWLGECLLGCAVVCWAAHLKQCRARLLRAWECAHRCCRISCMQGYAAVWVDGWKQNADGMESVPAGFVCMASTSAGCSSVGQGHGMCSGPYCILAHRTPDICLITSCCAACCAGMHVCCGVSCSTLAPSRRSCCSRSRRSSGGGQRPSGD